LLSPTSSSRRWLRAAIGLVSVSAVVVLTVNGAIAAPGGRNVAAQGHGAKVLVHPHGRFGLIPTVQGPRSVQAGQLRYGGGVDGIGVTTGAPRVYIVYWGTQWGTSSIGGDGYTHFTGDSVGYAPDQQAFFKGVGTASEQWSGVVTQYCEGVSPGTMFCPSNVPHVGYPTGGAIAGVWYDNRAAAPAQATQAQIAAEAVAAAQHFGNTTPTSNRNSQYVITSPHGTNPDNYKNGGFCAWHDYTTSQYGDLPYTNMPYLTDVGASCGMNFVNSGSAGTLDGVTIVGGHEYAETITDQNPPGGWLDTSGEENADKCAWIGSGQGASQNITLTTGTFAVQSSWANDFNNNTGGCLIFHPIFNGGSPDFTISDSPSSITIQQGHQGSTTVTTSVSGGFNAAITLSSSGLPSGASAAFSPNPIPAPGGGSSTATITVGASTTPGTYAVTLTGTGGGTSHGTALSLTVTSSGGGGGNLLGNPGFETGSASPWVATAGVINNNMAEPPHSGSWDAWLDGYGRNHTDTLYQQVAVPSSGSTATLTFWLHIDTAETSQSIAYDTLKVQIRNPSNAILATLATYSNLNKGAGYSQKSFNVGAYRGQTIRVYLLGVEDSSLQTSFVVDDFSLSTS
jgi:serine protease